MTIKTNAAEVKPNLAETSHHHEAINDILRRYQVDNIGSGLVNDEKIKSTQTADEIGMPNPLNQID